MEINEAVFLFLGIPMVVLLKKITIDLLLHAMFRSTAGYQFLYSGLICFTEVYHKRRSVKSKNFVLHEKIKLKNF